MDTPLEERLAILRRRRRLSAARSLLNLGWMGAGLLLLALTVLAFTRL